MSDGLVTLGGLNRVVRRGTFTLNGATPVTVAVPGIKATSIINYSLNATGGTPGAYPTQDAAIVNNTSFSIKGASGDTSVYNYAVLV